jgi:hypothetical protein
VQIYPSDHPSVFIPTVESLNKLLKAAYFEIVSQSSYSSKLSRSRLIQRRGRIGAMKDGVTPVPSSSSKETSPPHCGAGKPYRLLQRTNRAFTICRPFEGVNQMHRYKPPFGLAAYGSRFCTTATA